MKYFTVDLYDYFGVSKPEQGVATLTCYVRDNSSEISPQRLNPAMLVLPGGGYGMVSEREGEPIALAFLNKGFSSFVLKYSVAPVRFPYQLTEAVMAMNYIRLNAKDLLIDENSVAAVGFSAGGHLCATLATIPDCEDVAENFDSKINPKPNAVILAYPVITSGEKTHYGSFCNLCGEGNVELQNRLDITNLVNENSAPAFIWATYEDACVPVKNSIMVADAYDKAGVQFSLHIWGKGAHGLSVADKTVYGDATGGYGILDGATKSVFKWVDLAVEWLDELSIGIKK